ncbi:MAG: 3-hydroxyacyl-CoA dehydrogenase [Bacteroidia bacterium]|nr:3-hydroxyacyl-CoA dehydrogenase [Bacteroidia bacterium]
MKTLVIVQENMLEEAKKSLWHKFNPDYESYLTGNEKQYDLIVDLSTEEAPIQITRYFHLKEKLVVVASVCRTLLESVAETSLEPECFLFGCNALPYFLSRPVLELTAYETDEQHYLAATLSKNEIPFYFVADQVGMVTPRVICKIINEAFFMLQEGSASEEDIDLSMKLGTNYPYGPFEWAEIIGIKNVYTVLEAMQHTFKSDQFKIAPLLHQLYLRQL